MIKGKLLKDAIISAANKIANHRAEVDALNVFPVPDGDTGTNMTMTIAAAKRELEKLSDTATVAEVSNTAASALLRGARGNSGVILSLLFRGFSNGLQGKTVASASDVANAFTMGVEAAYKAVMKPTEGTILTVSRLAAAASVEKAKTAGEDLNAVWNELMRAGNEALANTPELLPVLKKAGVVDAGGKGLMLIFEGMGAVLLGGTVVTATEESNAPMTASPSVSFEELGDDITFFYCTEFIIDKTDRRQTGIKLRAYLESIGDSVLVVDDDDIIKVHVHTDNPGKALSAGVRLGTLSKMKIENMREQFENEVKARGESKPQEKVTEAKEEFSYQEVDPNMEYGFVAIAAGEGITALFEDLGVNNVVSGGQTMNPSTDDILKAIHATPAKNVFVLPNNKNIIMASEQAVHLADRKVHVLHTKTIPQGINAMISFEPDNSPEDNHIAMTESFEQVVTGQITFAARDSDFDGHKIKEGEILALESGKLAFTEKNISKAAAKLAGQIIKKKGDENAFVTIIYGEGIGDGDIEEVESLVKAKHPNCETVFIEGNQPVYYYIISID